MGHIILKKGIKHLEIRLSKSALRVIARMDVPTKQRIREGLAGLPQGDIKPLRGSPGNFRLRVGDWRIIFDYADNDTIEVKKIAPRGDAYKEMK
jgi:mRNA interferase RelE/StbE